MNLPCPECSLSIALSMNGDSTYIWCCECGYVLDTSISTDYDLKLFSRRIGFKLDDPAWAGRRDKLEGLNAVEPIQVYMPQLLYAFVKIRWPGWCVNCYDLCIKPYLNSIEALEYMTKTAVDTCGAWRTRGGGLMYEDLYRYLSNVDDPVVREHVRKNCCRGSGDD